MTPRCKGIDSASTQAAGQNCIGLGPCDELLRALSALMHDAGVTYSPHRHEWLVKLFSFGFFTLSSYCSFIVKKKKKRGKFLKKSMKTHRSECVFPHKGDQGSSMSHLKFGKHRDPVVHFPTDCSCKTKNKTKKPLFLLTTTNSKE